MKKMYIVYTVLFNTGYFIGLYNTRKEAERVAKQYEDAKVEIYTE